MDSAAYVLQPFSSGETEILAMVLKKATDAVECFVSESMEVAMNQFNGKLE